MHIFAALISFFHNFLGEYAPQWHLQLLMLCCWQINLDIYKCIYTFCVEGHARKKIYVDIQRDRNKDSCFRVQLVKAVTPIICEHSLLFVKARNERLTLLELSHLEP